MGLIALELRSYVNGLLTTWKLDLPGVFITLTRRVRHVKQPDLVRRCFTVSDPGALFLLTRDGFELDVMLPPASGTTKKVVKGGWSKRGT